MAARQQRQGSRQTRQTFSAETLAETPKSRKNKRQIRPVTRARSLFPVYTEDWLNEEEIALVKFILLSAKDWPIRGTVSYWECASNFVYNYCEKSGHLVEKRTSTN